MFNEQTIKFEFKELAPLGRICTPATGLVIFMTKQKSLKKIFEWIIIYC